ncbi:hypothetical protein AQUCO_01900009v1 [Aquilegia coerulea]|uniref:2-carboxy-D-arabinitol-1-phosphatase n=1 Tax=Aquilegia coerulea TaxID=218851 RepID=A0A2G5DIJ6_AQUCA|nr:hypothetical protein AQUCO_01900009v1 [Aquilegia coerulea]
MSTSFEGLLNYQTLFFHKKPKYELFFNRKPPKFFPIQPSSSLQEIQNSPHSEQSSFPSIKSAKRVVLVRHGQSTWNEEGRIQGSSNFSVLTQKGETQAETSRQMLLNDTFDVCFASPLARSRRTAEIIWNTRKDEIVTDLELREIDLYSFQGLLKHQGKLKFGEAYLKWQKDAPNFNIDGHYPVRELWDRARNCWTKILNHQGKSVLVVAHNAVNQALISTAIGLGTEYFRILVQSNCGVTVLDFTPNAQGGSPHICLNRLNQTPYSPIATTSSDGRKSSKRIIFACHGSTHRGTEDNLGSTIDGPLDMLGIIQSQKTAELLLDLNVSLIICSTRAASMDTALTISKVQEAAEYLGADYVSRYVEMKQMQDLEVESILWKSKQGAIEDSQLQPGWLNGFDDGLVTEIWNRAGKVWKTLLEDLSNESEAEKNLVVVGHPAVHMALIGHSLNLTKEWMGSFHLDAGSISVVDFPDGPSGGGVVRCTNYTAHLGRWSMPVSR